MAAGQRPELFARTVLVDPVLPARDWAEPDPGRESRGSELVDGARNRRHVWRSRAEAREKWRGKQLFESWDPRALDLYLQEGMRDREDGQVELKCLPEVEARIFEAPGKLDNAAAAARLTIPAKLIWASRGNFPRSVYETIVGHMSDGTIEEMDAGHLVPMEEPERVADAVLRFCQPNEGQPNDREA